jgi:NADPH-dependent ferric siderophore reductase
MMDFRMSQTAFTPPRQDDTGHRSPRRVRHETRRRPLVVTGIQKISAHMLRVTLGGESLAGFTSLGFDDHIKLFFPEPGTGHAEGEAPAVSRDYTPRHYDPAANTLTVDFALHDAGPATRWAETAEVGHALTIGGPRGSFIIPTDYDWHLLIGDDTALPAIARRLEELPAGTRVVVLAEVDGPADEIAFQSDADVSVTWVHSGGAERGATDALSRALRAQDLPPGDFYAWVACESLTAKALRVQLLAECGANPKWLRAAGYWRRGTAASHDTYND